MTPLSVQAISIPLLRSHALARLSHVSPRPLSFPLHSRTSKFDRSGAITTYLSCPILTAGRGRLALKSPSEVLSLYYNTRQGVIHGSFNLSPLRMTNLGEHTRAFWVSFIAISPLTYLLLCCRCYYSE